MKPTKSTVSRQIQALENKLGVTLIKRDPRHFSLTNEVSALLKQAESIVHQTKEAFEEISNIQAGLKGTVSISTTADLSLIYLAKPIANFSIQHPDLEFFIDLSPGQVDLKADGFDMAICTPKNSMNTSPIFLPLLNIWKRWGSQKTLPICANTN